MFAALPLAVDPSGILDRLSVAAWIFDIDHGQVVWANRSGLELWRAEDIAALAVRDMNFDMSASVARRLRQYQDDFVRKQSVFSELWTLYPGGVSIGIERGPFIGVQKGPLRWLGSALPVGPEP